MQNNIDNILLICCGFMLMANVFAEPYMVRQPTSNQSVTATQSQTFTATSPIDLSNDKSGVASQLSLSQPSYTIELQVDDYGDVARKKSFTKALGDVLIRDSNNTRVIELPQIKEALARPDFYVLEYNYINRDIVPNKQVLFLKVTFDKPKITNLLKRTSKVVWVNNKPVILTFLVKDTIGGSILSDNDEMVSIFKKKAKDLDMSIILPVLDLQDLSTIKSSDICDLKEETIKKASKRYGNDVIIAGCIRPADLSKPSILGKSFSLDKFWSSRWLLLQGTKSYSFNFIGNNAEDVIVQALRAMATKVTGKVIPVIGKATKIVLRITNVNNLGQYNEIERYLHKFSQIKQIDLLNINETEIELGVNVIGGEQTLLNALAGSTKLISNTDIVESPPGIDLDYKLVTLENEKYQATNTQSWP